MVIDGGFVQENARLPMEVNVSGKVIFVTASQSPKRKSGITLTGNSRSVSQIGCYINRFSYSSSFGRAAAVSYLKFEFVCSDSGKNILHTAFS